jgi:hypothetical protein
MTSQNHGYAVTVPLDHPTIKPLFTNLNDGSNEGLYWTDRKWFSVQFHPEAKSGPTDTIGLFDAFKDLLYPTDSLLTPQAAVWKSLKATPRADDDAATWHLNRVLGHPSLSPSEYRKVLILGSGGLSIGQSGEFDYSGSQAIKAYRQAGKTIVLINPNIATVQTSPESVDKVYYSPITPEYVEQIISLERPDCIALSFGGQTALNCGSKLYYSGVLAKYGVSVLGTSIDSITITEDRDLFKQHILSIGEKICDSACANTANEAITIATQIGYPVLVRVAFALGGLGSGFAATEEELRKILSTSFSIADQVIIDRSFRGWKELEYVSKRRYINCFLNIIPLQI